MVRRLTPERRREIAARAEKATRGPWKHYHDKLRPQFSGVIDEVQRPSGESVVQWRGFDASASAPKQQAKDAAFIAAARTDLPRLAEDWLRRLKIVERAYSMLSEKARAGTTLHQRSVKHEARGLAADKR